MHLQTAAVIFLEGPDACVPELTRGVIESKTGKEHRLQGSGFFRAFLFRKHWAGKRRKCYGHTAGDSNFVPQDACERENKAALLADLARYGEGLFLRTQEDAHLTASGFILDPEMRETLMVYHLIYQSFSWTGGHADGETDLLSVALREAKEETGVTEIWPLSGQILSIDRFWVPAHQKHGRAVKAHVHYSVAYGLIAPKNQTLTVKSDENSAVEWIAESMLEENCQEKKMIPVYRKIWARMQAINAERATLYARLPGALLPWYKEHARNLPWRQDREPYHVWVSEIMLQQTRVEAVKGYYVRFLAVLPTVEALGMLKKKAAQALGRPRIL